MHSMQTDRQTDRQLRSMIEQKVMEYLAMVAPVSKGGDSRVSLSVSQSVTAQATPIQCIFLFANNFDENV